MKLFSCLKKRRVLRKRYDQSSKDELEKVEEEFNCAKDNYDKIMKDSKDID